MKEKTGNTEKLIYDFETAANLESFIPNLNGWYRQTAREFRSSSYKRRINEKEYIGPIYKYGTNKLVKANITPNSIIEHNWVSKKRPGE